MYQRALNADPNHAHYAHLLFITNRDVEAIRHASSAIDRAADNEEPLLAECHFYLFMRVPDHREASGRELRAILAKGVSTDTWDFGQHLQRREREGDPRLPLLTTVADALRKGDPAGLDEFEEWRALG